MQPTPSLDAGLSAELRERLEALDLWQNVRELRDNGYTIIQDPVAHALTDRVRTAVQRLAAVSEGRNAGRRAGLLLGRDAVFPEAVTVPKLLALVEYLLGRGALLSQLIGTVRRAPIEGLALHADNSWFPAPFPSWEIMCTACWVTDDFTRENGATLIIPGTHKHKHHPPREVRESLDGAIAIEAPPGSIALWDGSVWHGSYPRQTDGERVVLHMTYTRIGMQPIDDYSHLDDAWLADKDPQLRGLLGRDLFFHSTTERNGSTDFDLLMNTYRLVHGPQGY
ncbi:phytanoyl-CoA dioxygenase family protein [Sphingomonas sp.]|uniref:phytanoyl-CoA dioxygenase family protein n=1 Tax=Sphingomonas sp. TaxID=28214 RepID=UPI002CDBEE86|nr:phytanoyl-CoA dioxygenase family protein [Sphingomonas sp.]HWK35913.1 phytanoyl-CoA dioxygenase family protein [Sphingomonas sp.]